MNGQRESFLIQILNNFFTKEGAKYVQKKMSVIHRGDIAERQKFTRGTSQISAVTGMFGLGDREGGYGKDSWDDRYLRLVRPQRYAEYELMLYTPEIDGSIETYIDETLTMDYFGDTIKVFCNGEKIKEEVEKFLELIEFNKNADDWIKSMLTEGDQFVPLQYEKNKGVIDYLTVLDPMRIEILEEWDESSEQIVRTYKWGQELGINEDNTFFEFEMLHFCYKGTKSRFYPFGESILETLRPSWRNLIRAEDAMLLHRISRATDRYAFYVDVSGLSPTDSRTELLNIKNIIKTDKYIDSYGNIAEKPKVLRILDDFFFPSRGGNKSVEVVDLRGTEMKSASEDVEYFKKKIFNKLRVPPAFLGEERGSSGKNLLSQQDFRFARSIERVQKIVTEELLEKAIYHLLALEDIPIKDIEDSDLQIVLVNPSTIYLEQRLELINNKLKAASDAKRTELISDEWIYQNMLGFTSEDVDMIRSQMIGDKFKEAIFSAIGSVRDFEGLTGIDVDWKAIFRNASPAMLTIVNSILKTKGEEEFLDVSFEPEELKKRASTKYTFNRPDINPMGITGESSILRTKKKGKKTKCIFDRDLLLQNSDNYNGAKITKKIITEANEKYKCFDPKKQKQVLKEIKEKVSTIDLNKERTERNEAIKKIMSNMR